MYSLIALDGDRLIEINPDDMICGDEGMGYNFAVHA